MEYEIFKILSKHVTDHLSVHFQFAWPYLYLFFMIFDLFVFEIYNEKKVLGERFWFLHGLYCSIKYFIWNKKLSFIKLFHVFMLLSCIFNQFFMPLVDVNRGGWGSKFLTLTLSMEQWVWMAPLIITMHFGNSCIWAHDVWFIIYIMFLSAWVDTIPFWW